MKKYLNSSSIYILLWCLYNLQGALYPSGSLLAKLLLFIILIWSIFSFIRVNIYPNSLPSFLKASNLFLLIMTFYGVVLIISGQELYITEDYAHIKSYNHDYLKNIYLSLLPIYVCYDYSRSGKFDQTHINLYTATLLPVFIINFIYSYNQAVQLASRLEGFSGATLNVGYKFLSMFPLVLLMCRNYIKYILLLICTFFILLSVKRGAILIAFVCFIYFLYTTLKNAQSRRRGGIVVLTILSIVIVYFITNEILESYEYFIRRLESTIEGNTSNRNVIYKTYFTHFISETNLFRFVFGNGANSTLKIGFNYAHNDWLELAINNGLTGVIIYALYFIALIKDYFALKKKKFKYANVVFMAFIIMFMSSIFSMSYATISMPIAISLGYTMVYVNRNTIIV